MSILGALGGAALGNAVVTVGLDTKSLSTGLAKARGEVEAGTSRMAAAAKNIGPMLAAGIGVGLALVGKAAVQAAMEAEQAMAQTEAVLKSTGGAANVTAEQIVALANELAALSGVDDEVIQSSSNLLLTFTEIQNQAGANNDIFNQTQAAVLDMAVAMNQGSIANLDLKSASLQVGKALNNPLVGMTALQRVGVSFTQTEKEKIAALQESGDLLGAQKMILAELTTEFGGSAEAAGNTFAGAMGKARSQVRSLSRPPHRSQAPHPVHLPATPT
ncbi:MAG: hypothetical protein WD206_07190 [Actinomycetota bacterium]